MPQEDSPELKAHAGADDAPGDGGGRRGAVVRVG